MHGSAQLNSLLTQLHANALMKAAAISVDAADMMPPAAPPGAPGAGMMPQGAPAGTQSQELRAAADETPDVAEKQMLMNAADKFDALEAMNAPTPPQMVDPAAQEQAMPQQMAADSGAQQAPPPKTASAKSILDDDGNLVDFTSAVSTDKTAADDVSAEDLDSWCET